MVDIVELVGVLIQVEEFPFGRLALVDGAGLAEGVGVVVDEFVAVSADAVVGVDVVVGQVHPVAIVHDLGPVFRGGALEQGAEAAALEAFGLLGAGVV